MNRILIPKGRHRPKGLLLPRLHFGSFDLRFAVRFTDESDYSFCTADDYDINKLAGISWNGYHHQHSVRIGWNTKGLWLYSYQDYERRVQRLGDYEKEKDYSFCLRSVDDCCVVQMNGRAAAWLDMGSRFRFGYRLGHYFGGNNPAPKDIIYRFNSL